MIFFAERRGGNVIEHKMCVSILSETFFILSRIETDMLEKV